MKHVWKHPDGTYLSVGWNRELRRRATTELQKARVFSSAGPAKNAARQAGVEGRAVPVGLVLQELEL